MVLILLGISLRMKSECGLDSFNEVYKYLKETEMLLEKTSYPAQNFRLCRFLKVYYSCVVEAMASGLHLIVHSQNTGKRIKIKPLGNVRRWLCESISEATRASEPSIFQIGKLDI